MSWFNPPFNSTVRTNIGAEFLKLIDKCFPPGHPLKKIINRNTVAIVKAAPPIYKPLYLGEIENSSRSAEISFAMAQ